MNLSKPAFIIILVVSILFINTAKAQSKNASSVVIKNLVFEGGGIRGIAYVGALMELRDRHLLDSICRVAGTSAGAIAATLYSLGYTPEEISQSIYDLRIKSMADGQWIFIGGTTRLIRKFGWYKGDEFKKWISKLIKAKTGKEDLTFAELESLSLKDARFKQLFLTGTNLSQQKLVIFCQETFPTMEVRNAVRISMGIPLFYQAVVLDEKGCIISKKKDFNKGSVFVDGGIIGNFPIHIFDYEKYLKPSGDSIPFTNYQTLGFRLDHDQQILNDQQSLGLAPVEINSFRAYTTAFYNIICENLNRQNLTKEDWLRTVSISTMGIAPRVRAMSQSEKNILIESGKKGVREYFKDLK